MNEEKYNFNYKVISVNIENGTFEVEYSPENPSLSPITLNTYLIFRPYEELLDANNVPLYSSQDEVPFDVHLENTVRLIAPLIQWKRQYILQTNIENIFNGNGTMYCNSDLQFVANTAKN